MELENANIGLFIPCCEAQLAPELGEKAKKLLSTMGLRWGCPDAYLCCGKEFLLAGDRDSTLRLANEWMGQFQRFDYVVSTSVGCVSFMKRYYPRVFANSLYEASCARMLPKLYDLSDFLVHVAHYHPSAASFPHRVAVMEHCSSFHQYGRQDSLWQLLQEVQAIELLQFPNPDNCCGKGGWVDWTFPPLSQCMAASRAHEAASLGAQYVVGTEYSCLHHLQESFSREKLPIQCRHLLDLLVC